MAETRWYVYSKKKNGDRHQANTYRTEEAAKKRVADLKKEGMTAEIHKRLVEPRGPRNPDAAAAKGVKKGKGVKGKAKKTKAKRTKKSPEPDADEIEA